LKRLAPLLVAAGAVPFLLSVADDGGARLRDPEHELKLAKTALDNLVARLDAARAAYTRPGLGPQTVFAERALANARRFFAHDEYLSAVRELNAFLNLTQVPEVPSYLAAQYMLGRSYEAMGYPSKSLRAYFRYLSACLTAPAPDQDELLDVLRRMVPLAALDLDKPKTNRELGELIASITSLDLGERARPAVFYLSAKAVANTGRAQLATNFLDTALGSAQDPKLKARALYMRALIALGVRDFDKAEDALSESIQVAADADPSTRDLARLALARLAVHRRRADTALKYYALVQDDTTPAYKSGLFESVYVHLKLRQESEARAKALQYLARYPEGPEALQLRTLLAYLDLRAGDLASASQSIAAADKRLSDIDTFVRRRFTGRTAVGQGDLVDLLHLTEGQLAPIPTMSEGHKMFVRLAEITRRLADARGELRNVYFTLGRAALQHLRPRWVNRAESLAKMGDDILEVGHRLIATERHLYADRLDPVDLQKLDASANRRTKLLTPLASARRKMDAWASQLAYLDLTRDVAGRYKRLKDAEADLATSRYLLQAGDDDKKPKKKNAFGDDIDAAADGSGGDGKANRVRELEQRAAKIGNALARSVELLRARKVEGLLQESPHRAERKFLTQYAMALNDEAALVARAREDAKSSVETLMASDATESWRLWEFAVKQLFKDLDDLDKEIGQSLKAMIAELEDAEDRHNQLESRLKEVTTALEGRLGQSLAYVMAQYAGAVDARRARHRKWRADIEWLTYQGKSEDERRLDARYQLEEQILKDQLTDLQQGVTWQWPD
jgi:hypothetical protein